MPEEENLGEIYNKFKISSTKKAQELSLFSLVILLLGPFLGPGGNITFKMRQRTEVWTQNDQPEKVYNAI